MKHLFFLVGLLCLTAAPISSFAQAQKRTLGDAQGI